MKQDRAVIAASYHPVEAAIIRIALGRTLSAADAIADVWNRQGSLPAGVVHLQPSAEGDADEEDDDDYDLDDEDEQGGALARAASDAVARLALEGVATRLPTYRSYSDGVIASTREKAPPRNQSLRFLPSHLLTLNWASGPGLDWPEAYHLAWLPGFERWLVLGSYDTPEIDGYCDRVAAHFGPCEDPIASAKRRVRRHWATERDRVGQERWESVLRSGRISADEAEKMAQSVWQTASYE